jgi:hypothetical protein
MAINHDVDLVAYCKPFKSECSFVDRVMFYLVKFVLNSGEKKKEFNINLRN